MPQFVLVPEPHFDCPQHFQKLPNGLWSCYLCTPHGRAHLETMTMSQAMAHEKLVEHRAKANAWNPWDEPFAPGDWYSPYDILETRDKVLWADHCSEMVAFWRRGVAAAEKGEQVEKLQDFFLMMDKRKEKYDKGMEDVWASSRGADPWGWDGGVAADVEKWELAPSDGWNPQAAAVSKRKPRKKSKKKKKQWPSSDHTVRPDEGGSDKMDVGLATGEGDLSSFAEKYARRRSVNAAQKEKMNTFLEMPTEQKVNKIQEMIHSLHARV
ncbi:hypothetical protein EW146_g2556 [Bondarzewia mesenterica]|uniref:Uncharacterized protein n=1 Tax=Bondarzewia mesenterica TaxID=1095465 RepID=A0A4S4M2K1_9AGAM|nr:hypothetical protein EW146_g2556 [Bondarzewia mesenterica]